MAASAYVVIVDVDGTLALRGSRSPYDFRQVKQDRPNKPVIELVRVLAARARIVYISGRDDSCSQDTRDWLDQHVGACGDLFMRRSGDKRRDSIIKEEIFRREIEGQAEVWFVLDDRDQTVDMWRSLGLTCLQVARGDF